MAYNASSGDEFSSSMITTTTTTLTTPNSSNHHHQNNTHSISSPTRNLHRDNNNLLTSGHAEYYYQQSPSSSNRNHNNRFNYVQENTIGVNSHNNHRKETFLDDDDDPYELDFDDDELSRNNSILSGMDQVKSSRSNNYHHLENMRSPLLINNSPSPLFRKFKTSLPTKIKYFNKGFFNVIVLGVSFLILFSAFNILLFYFTEIRRRITASAIVLYSSLSGFSIITPSIIKLFGLRTSIMAGAFLYALFVLSLSLEMAPVSYTMSTISGFGGSLLWIANGEILTRAANYYQRMAKKERNKMEIDHFNSAFTVSRYRPLRKGLSHADDVMGLYSGVFFAIYQLNSLLGNLISTSMLKLSLGEFWLFLILFIISLFGIILLIPLRNISFHETISNMQLKSQPRKVERTEHLRNNDSSFKHLDTGKTIYPKTVVMKSDSSLTVESATINDDTDDEASSNLPSMYEENLSVATIEYELPKPPSRRDRLLTLVANVLMYIRDTISVILSPKMILFSVIFFYSGYSIAFFYRVLPRVMQKHSNSFLVPWAVACFGLSEVVGSLLFGRLSDKIGKRPVMIATIVFHVLAISSSFATVYWPPSYITYFVPQIICGLADSGLNVVIYSVLGGTGDYFKYSKTSEAFSSFKAVQGLGICIGIVFGTLFSVQTVQFTLAGVLFVSILFYIALDWNFPIDGKRKPKKTKHFHHHNNMQPHEPYF